MEQPKTPAPVAFPKQMRETITLKQPLDEGTRKWQLSSTDTIEELRQRLRGAYFNESTGKWTTICAPWMNEEGIGRVSNILNFYINKNMQLSYFEPDTIENMELAFCRELSEYMRFHYRQYGIMKEHVGIICHMLADSVYAALMRARFGKESQFIENTEQRNITTVEGQGQGQQGSIMSKIPLLGGKFK